MQPRRLAAALVLAFYTLAASAGHGLMNTFSDLRELPDPGLTPDQFGYTLDAWNERARLTLATTATARYALCLEFAREKLAEVTAMVSREQVDAAATAINGYADYIDAAAAALAEPGGSGTSELADRFAVELLEHQYLMSIDYIDLPRGSRSAISGVIDAAAAHYSALEPLLSPGFKASQFFKEEEVRWSWSMAQAADEQNL